MAFDKTGEYIASGALGGSLYVWSVKDGNIVRSFCKLKKDGGEGREKALSIVLRFFLLILLSLSFLLSSPSALYFTQLAVAIFSKLPGIVAANGWPLVTPQGKWPCSTSANSIKIVRGGIEWACRLFGMAEGICKYE